VGSGCTSEILALKSFSLPAEQGRAPLFQHPEFLSRTIAIWKNGAEQCVCWCRRARLHLSRSWRRRCCLVFSLFSLRCARDLRLRCRASLTSGMCASPSTPQLNSEKTTRQHLLLQESMRGASVRVGTSRHTLACSVFQIGSCRLRNSGWLKQRARPCSAGSENDFSAKISRGATRATTQRVGAVGAPVAAELEERFLRDRFRVETALQNFAVDCLGISAGEAVIGNRDDSKEETKRQPSAVSLRNMLSLD